MCLRYLVFLVMLSAAVPAFLEGPPLAHTGGFGEPTCLTCHFDGDLNDLSGSLQIRGLPDRYVPGSTYPIEIILVKAGLKHAGFQASVREAITGKQAGTWVDPPIEVKVQASESGVEYAMQTRAGTTAIVGDTARWQFSWRAPERSSEPVIIHVAGNAADGDESPFGDAIYADSLQLDPMH
jgi:hypothetical protein